MNKIEKLLKNLNEFIQKAEDEEESLTDIVPDFPGLDGLPAIIEDYEKAIARLLRVQRKFYLDALSAFVSKNDSITLEAFLIYLKSDLFAADEFAEKFGEQTASFLKMTIEELAKLIMESIDEDVQFEILSYRTSEWIKQWSKDLADIMQLNTHKSLENELLQAINEGESIAEVELRIKDLPQFNRNRARATARTEILTASSRAHYESFMQSPAVTGKRWKHSGAKKSKPRTNHVELNGTAVGIDDYFIIPNSNEPCQYPRDPMLSPNERVNCGCVIGPVVNNEILGLSKEEKEAIRQEVLEVLNN